MASKEEAIGYLKALISAEKGERLPQPEFGKDRLRVLQAIVEAFEGEGSGGGSGGSTGGGVLFVNGTVTENVDESTDYTIDKTWKEIHDAGFAVLRIVNDEVPDGVQYLQNDGILKFAIGPFEGNYLVSFIGFDAGGAISNAWEELSTDNENGYPSVHKNAGH